MTSATGKAIEPPDLMARVKAAMPSLAGLPEALERELQAALIHVHLPAGAPVFGPTDSCPGFPIVLDGRVQVTRTLDNGRELLLYDVESGESCVMSTACMLGNRNFGAHGHCVADVDLALIPRPVFEKLLAQHPAFRADVFTLFTDRLVRLMELVEAVGFQRLDQRLAAALLGKGQRLQTSHEQLAHSLGASRESVSRQLKHFEDRGLVRLGRGVIDVVQPRALRELAAGTARAEAGGAAEASGAASHGSVATVSPITDDDPAAR